MELVIGIVAPIGVDYAVGVQALESKLRELRLEVAHIRLSQLLSAVPDLVKSSDRDEHARILSLMQAGNDLRKRTKDGSAAAKLAVLEIRRQRKARSGSSELAATNVAYVLQSLKNPREVEFLRATYGDAFVLISLYEPRDERVSSLAEKIATTKHESDLTRYRHLAEEIVRKDEKDGGKLGQRVSDSFAEADFFVGTTHRSSAASAIDRFVEIFFSHPFHTPTIDEYGMFLAWGVSLRSADLSRQVGAAVCDSEGNVVAVGCNDVPKAGGGQYWPEDDDARDFQRGFDSSAKEKRRLVAEISERLADAGWLTEEKAKLHPDERLDLLFGDSEDTVLKDAGIHNLLEFGRIVHAEMAAIADAAKRGVSLQGKTLYTTTFPCHVCARHIVAAGVARVVYVEPYPKSRASDLHSDSIIVDRAECSGADSKKVSFEAFTGISPRRFGVMFRMPDRKNSRGEALRAAAQSTKARLVGTPLQYLQQETVAIQILNKLLEETSASLDDAAKSGEGGV